MFVTQQFLFFVTGPSPRSTKYHPIWLYLCCNILIFEKCNVVKSKYAIMCRYYLFERCLTWIDDNPSEEGISRPACDRCLPYTKEVLRQWRRRYLVDVTSYITCSCLLWQQLSVDNIPSHLCLNGAGEWPVFWLYITN